MESEPICKEFLEMLFGTTIEKITYLSSQNTVTSNSGAKTVRFDVLVKDKTGSSYDIEMQVGNEYNIPKWMRYYQAVLDVAFLDKGYSYKALNDSFIIFISLLTFLSGLYIVFFVRALSSAGTSVWFTPKMSAVRSRQRPYFIPCCI